MRWAGQIQCMKEITNVYNISVGKPEDTIWKKLAQMVE
jgi:hypothetical protein